MAGVAETDFHAGKDLALFPVAKADHVLQGGACVIDGVKRRDRRLVLAGAPFVLVLCIPFLQVRRILEQDVAQIDGRILSVDGT